MNLYKKIGDRVDQGELLYRLHAFEQSEFDLALAMAKADAGYALDGHNSPEGAKP